MQCNKCKFVGNVIGGHRSCNVLNDTKLGMLVATGLAEINISNKDGTNSRPAVQISDWGKSHGWADWPIQFDPIWIDKCEFYTQKEDISFPQPG